MVVGPCNQVDKNTRVLRSLLYIQHWDHMVKVRKVLSSAAVHLVAEHIYT